MFEFRRLEGRIGGRCRNDDRAPLRVPQRCPTELYRQLRMMTSVNATSTAAAAAAQISSPGGRRRGCAEPSRRPQAGQAVASAGTIAVHSPQRISTRRQRPTVPSRDDVVTGDGQRSNQLRMYSCVRIQFDGLDDVPCHSSLKRSIAVGTFITLRAE